MFFSIFLVILISLIILMHNYQGRQKQRHYMNKFEGPPSIPLIGNALSFIGDPMGKFPQIYKNKVIIMSCKVG